MPEAQRVLEATFTSFLDVNNNALMLCSLCMYTFIWFLDGLFLLRGNHKATSPVWLTNSVTNLCLLRLLPRAQSFEVGLSLLEPVFVVHLWDIARYSHRLRCAAGFLYQFVALLLCRQGNRSSYWLHLLFAILLLLLLVFLGLLLFLFFLVLVLFLLLLMFLGLLFLFL